MTQNPHHIPIPRRTHRVGRFRYWSTAKLLNLTASPDARTDIGTDYGHLIQNAPKEQSEAHKVLWDRANRTATKSLMAHQDSLNDWETFLDSIGVPPIPEAYWSTLYPKHLGV